MLKMNAYITAKEIKIHDHYTGRSEWVLFEFEGRGYIGQLVTSFMNKLYEFVPVTETAYEVWDDDATGLWLPEFEGVFSCRCIDMEVESEIELLAIMGEFS